MKKNIAIITGGFSNESVVSFQSCKNVVAHIDTNRYSVYVICITTEIWFFQSGNKKIIVDKNDFSITINKNKIKFALCYIMLHGTPGEDGKLQSYFDLIKQKYISCNASVATLTFNKFYTTSVLKSLNFNVAKSFLLFKEQEINIAEIRLKYPVFVKPNNGGSSIGISKVNTPLEVAQAIQKAFKEDNQIIIEEQILGKEYTIGVYKNKQNKIIALPITSIESKNAFFDFDAKYNGQSIEITPARISASLKQQIESTAVNIYKQLNCDGVIRIDIIHKNNSDKLYILEINTVPGQTLTSFIPQQVLASKNTLKNFYTQLIEVYL